MSRYDKNNSNMIVKGDGMLKKSCMSLFVIVGLLLVNCAYTMEIQEEKSSSFDNVSVIKIADSQDHKQITKNNYQRPAENEPREKCCSVCRPVKCRIGCQSDICGCAYAVCEVGNHECRTYNLCFIACISVAYLPGCFVKKCLCIE